MNQLTLTRTGNIPLFKPVTGLIALHSLYIELKKPSLFNLNLKESGVILSNLIVDIPNAKTSTITIPANHYLSLGEIESEIQRAFPTFKITRLNEQVTLDIPKNLKMVFSRNLLQLFGLSMNLEGKFIQGQVKGTLPISTVKKPKMIYLHLNQLDRNSNMLDSQPSALLAALRWGNETEMYYEPGYPVFLPLNSNPRHDWLDIKLLDETNNEFIPEKIMLRLLNKQ